MPSVARFLPLAPLIFLVTCTGCTVFYANQPLDDPVAVTGIEAPGVLLLEDGRRVQVYGVRLVAAPEEAAASLAPLEADRAPSERTRLVVELMDPGATESRVDYRCKTVRFCGNNRLFEPTYARNDLGSRLVASGLALPTTEAVLADDQYSLWLAGGVGSWEELNQHQMKHQLHEPRRGGMPRPTIGQRLTADPGIQDAARQVALALARQDHVEKRVAGVKLLMLLDDVNSRREARAALTRRLDDLAAWWERESGKPGWSPHADHREPAALLDLLSRLDPDDAKARMWRIVHGYGDYLPYLKAGAACRLLALGDPAAVDDVLGQAVDRRRDESYRNGLFSELKSTFHFNYRFQTPADPLGALTQWYASVKDRLVWDGSRRQFQLGPEDKHSSAYSASMDPFLGTWPKP